MLGQLLESFRKLTPPALIAVSLASAALVFGPDGLIDTMGIAGFRESYRGWIGVAFLISTAYLFAHALWAGRGFASTFAGRRRDRARVEMLSYLTPDEQAYLGVGSKDVIHRRALRRSIGVERPRPRCGLV